MSLQNEVSKLLARSRASQDVKDCLEILAEAVDRIGERERGEKGEPGYTPVKGVDYFDGAPGPRGEPG